MTVLELIAAAKRSTVDERTIADLQRCVADAEKHYEEQANRRSVSAEALSRTYSL
ncbi:hypothetical protein [Paraburkholderia phenazinium]|uniref:hypothetical protein n=1 Tax=Paraburkholderia phenazinium TaxID=60549 RepID=UPI0015887006|nr:hypothetical protein [Paraburkholderia phenazinium]